MFGKPKNADAYTPASQRHVSATGRLRYEPSKTDLARIESAQRERARKAARRADSGLRSDDGRYA